MKVSKERKRRAATRAKMAVLANGKIKPTQKAVEEFRRPVYGMEKKDCKDCIHDSKQWHEDPCDGCCGGDAFERRTDADRPD